MLQPRKAGTRVKLPIVFSHACKLGFEGIVSKRKDSRYISGRSRHWIKSKNPQAPAVRREAEQIGENGLKGKGVRVDNAGPYLLERYYLAAGIKHAPHSGSRKSA